MQFLKWFDSIVNDWRWLRGFWIGLVLLLCCRSLFCSLWCLNFTLNCSFRANGHFWNSFNRQRRLFTLCNISNWHFLFIHGIYLWLDFLWFLLLSMMFCTSPSWFWMPTYRAQPLLTLAIVLHSINSWRVASKFGWPRRRGLRNWIGSRLLWR